MVNKEVLCNDGTIDTICIKDCPQTDVAVPPPCEKNGGVRKQKFTDTQKWLIVIGGSALIYYILYKAGSFSSK